jgi:hypothetical protein
MAIDGLNHRQTMIADLLWSAQSWDETEEIVAMFGQEAGVIRTMIILDGIDDDVAEDVQCAKANEALEPMLHRR